MLKYEGQSGFTAPGALHHLNIDAPLLSPVNQPYQFSDALDKHSSGILSTTDPRRLIAIMTQNRHQCRSSGLIKRDTTELILIGKKLGLAPNCTMQIIDHVRLFPDASYTDKHAHAFVDIPIELSNKKTRIPLRVLISLSIWAITIALAMQMV